MEAQSSTGSARFCISRCAYCNVDPIPMSILTSSCSQPIPASHISHRIETIIRRSANVTDLLSAHARLLRIIVHHDLGLPRSPLYLHRPDCVPNVAFNGKLCPILPGPVRNGHRHDGAPDEGSENENPQDGVSEGKITGTGVKMSYVRELLLIVQMSSRRI